MKLLDELLSLTHALNANGVDYALCGGLAMAVYDLPRATLDIDLMIPAEALDRVCQIAGEIGFTIAAEPMQFSGGRVRMNRITKIDPVSHEFMVLDLLLVTEATRPAWDSRRTFEWNDGELTVLSPDGLILLKSLRNSGQDQQDIEHLRSIADED